jgi:hypothetical protein
LAVIFIYIMKRKLQILSPVLLLFLSVFQLKAQVKPNPGFAFDFGVDTVWINSPYTFVNTSSNDQINYWDITPVTGSFLTEPARTCVSGFGCYIAVQASPNRNFRFTFDQEGTYMVKLVVRNTSGADSISKLIYVGHPTKKPVANFFIDKQIIGQSEQIPLYDLSQNGPTSWRWYLDPQCYTCSGPSYFPNLFLPSEFIQLPVLRATEGGKFGVCLIVQNEVGSDTLCKPNYVEVIAGTSCNATLQDTFTTLSEGYLFDNGGPAKFDGAGAYLTEIGSSGARLLDGKFFTVAPCASRIDLTVENLRFRNNDTLIIRELSKTGPIIAKLTGAFKIFTGSNVPFPAGQRVITSTTGRMVFEWKCAAGATNQTTDSGFVFKYTSVPATYGPPTASFTCPDVVYSGYNVKYINQSFGQGNLSYLWDADGLDSDGNPNNNTGYEFETANGANFTFTATVGEIYRNICLRVSNCKGTSQYCKLITIRPIVTAPLVDFSSPRPAGFTTDIFKLVDESKNGALAWEWTITPNNVTYVQGTNKNSQNPVFMLNSRGRYNVKLKATNPVGSDSAEKIMYIDVIAYSSPNVEYPIASGNDIGISRVKFADADTSTSLKTPIYDTLYTKKIGVMYRGVNYPIEVYRTTATNFMDRKIWIDTSLDGLFTAPGELIYSETNLKTLVANANFMLPNNIEPGRILRMRIGISEGNSTLTADKATSGCFEDYGIEIGLDNVPPTIELVGDSIHRIEINKPFVDPGVYAEDNYEGDISYKYEYETNVDTTRAGYYYKKYFVKDLYGNVSDTVYRVIQVEVNRTGPKLSLNAPDSVFLKVREDALSNVKAMPSAVNHLGAPMSPSLIIAFGTVDTSTIGNYTLGWTIIDQFGYTDTVYQRVYVRDITAPAFLIPSGTTLNHQIGSIYSTSRLPINDNYYPIDQLTLTANNNNHINVNVPNVYSLEYVLCDPSGNCSAPFNVLIDVKDTVAPSATLLGQNPYEVDVFDNTAKDKLKNLIFYSDNYYENSSLVSIFDASSLNTSQLGEYTVIYTVRDGAGNETRLERKVNVVDREAPWIDLAGGSTVDLVWNDTFVEPGFAIRDNYYSDLAIRTNGTVQITTTLSIDPNSGKWYGGQRGWKEVRYTATDPSNNVSRTEKRNVYVDFRTGLNNIAKNAGELKVYPNPSNGVFTLNTKDQLKGEVKVAIYNVLGSKIYTETINATGGDSYQVKTSGLSTGVYVLQVTNNGKQFTQRITIK